MPLLRISLTDFIAGESPMENLSDSKLLRLLMDPAIEEKDANASTDPLYESRAADESWLALEDCSGRCSVRVRFIWRGFDEILVTGNGAFAGSPTAPAAL